MRRALRLLLIGSLFLVLFAILSSLSAQESDVDEEILERGAYLTKISGCVVCHTPFEPRFEDPSIEDLVELSLFEVTALDTENSLLSGGRAFELGPAGAILSPNLTPHDETGLGDWTTEEIKAAIRLGVNKDGRQLHPIMPAHLYNNMAEEDLDAIVAYLQSIEPIENEVPEPQTVIPPRDLTPPEEPIVAPDPEDIEARGKYLMTGVLPCQECHTPLDVNTGVPVMEKYLAGGQPFEGPWGIIYSANITPHEETGIGSWTDEEKTRAIVGGVRVDGRRLVLMPWQDYASLSSADLAAVLNYLNTEVPPVENEVPDVALEDPFEVTADLE